MFGQLLGSAKVALQLPIYSTERNGESVAVGPLLSVGLLGALMLPPLPFAVNLLFSMSCQVASCPVPSCHVTSRPDKLFVLVLSRRVRSGLVASRPVPSGPVRSCPVESRFCKQRQQLGVVYFPNQLALFELLAKAPVSE